MIKFSYHSGVLKFEGHANTKEHCAVFSYIVDYFINTSAVGQSDKSDSIDGLALLDITSLSVRDTTLLWEMLEYYNDHVEKIEGIRSLMKED